MHTMIKTTPVHFSQKSLNPKWGEINNTLVALEFGTAQIEKINRQILGVTDTSCLSRFGVKGSKAADWLAVQGVTIPAEPNTWVSYEQSMVLRLGDSEFLIEDKMVGTACQKLNEAIETDPTGLYKVVRFDAAFIISGFEKFNLFSELCKLDLSSMEMVNYRVIITHIADISAIILSQKINGETVFRLWCDGTYGAYMWRVLYQLARELGGGAIGFSSYFSNG